ncbi:DNA mismatch repair protein [Arthrobotrys musiformis]|uniref:DNA mismatch repair protein n=1 Tax=Arthrobotrys musiformis TaxID=47236 RepID=A0AAV9VWD4_9PEZI
MDQYPRIRRLSDNVIAQIRSTVSLTTLASVTQGLVMNSLDANATTVTLYVNVIKNSVTVEDNGDGIIPADLQLIGDRYSTSKSEFSPKPTFGSQGEFLASLATSAGLAVYSRSKFYRATYVIRHHYGSRLKCEHVEKDEYMLPRPGTKVKVDRLFGNFPVRSLARESMSSSEIAKQWRDVERKVVEVLLVYGKYGRSAKVTIRDDLGAKQSALEMPVGYEGDIAARMGNLVNQAGCSRLTWEKINGEWNGISLMGIMAREGVSGQNRQYIFIDESPIENSMTSILYTKVNNMFTASNFGTIDDNGERKGSSRFLRKGVERYPAFVIFVEMNGSGKKVHAEDLELDSRNTIVSEILGLIEAVVDQFLVIGGWRTKMVPMPKSNPAERVSNKTKYFPERRSELYLDLHYPTTMRRSLALDELKGKNSRRAEPEPAGTLPPPVTQMAHIRLLPPARRPPTVSSQRIAPVNEPQYFQSSQTPAVSNKRALSTIGIERHNKIPRLRETSGYQQGIGPADSCHFATQYEDMAREDDYGPTTHGRRSRIHDPLELSLQQVELEDTMTGFPRRNLANPERQRGFSPIDLRGLSPIEDIPGTMVLRERSGPSYVQPVPRRNRGPTELPFLDETDEQIEERTLVPSDEPGTFQFRDPRTNEYSLFDSRTGNEIRTSKPSAIPKRLSMLPEQCKGCKSTDGWAANILSSTQSPIFKLPETQIPRNSLISDNEAANGEPVNAAQIPKSALREAKVLAQVDEKYILLAVEAPERLVVVDQHAADERVKVENLWKEFNNDPKPLSRETSFTINKPDSRILRLQYNHVRDWGFQLDFQEMSGPYGGVKVNVLGAPELVADRCIGDPSIVVALLKSWIPELLTKKATHGFPKDESEWKKRMTCAPKRLQDIVNSRACRSAIMFNDPLTMSECHELIGKLADCDFPFQCAHGRPSMVPVVSLERGGVVAKFKGDACGSLCLQYHEGDEV